MLHLWLMARSTKAEKAQHLNVARGLLQRYVARAQAVRRLSREFDLSERQAYRYLEKASQLDRPVEIPETTIPVTLKLPPTNRGTSPEIREKQRSDYRGNRSRRVACLSAYSQKAWLSRVQEATHIESISHIHLIACSSRSSRRLTRFWSHVANAPSA
jgi:hypothetical protein